jgi:PAS domain S-box-containing protein
MPASIGEPASRKGTQRVGKREIPGSAALDLESLPGALGRSEFLFRGIFDHAPTGIVITDHEDRFLRCNPAYEKMLGASASTLISHRVSDLVHPDDQAESTALFNQLKAGEIDYFETVSRFVKPSGETLWVHKYVSHAPADGDRPRGFLKLITDVTDNKHHEQVLAASEERFRTLSATLPAMIFVTDATGGNTFVNRQFEKFTGRSAQDITGDGWLKIVHPDDRERAARTWEECWRSGEIFVAEFRMRRADGAWRSFYTRSRPIRDSSGSIVEWVGASIEIQLLVDARNELAKSSALLEQANNALENRVEERTAELREEIAKREAAQAALLQSQKLEALGQLTSGIAHDFNNILAAIGGGYDLISKRIDDPFVAGIASQCRDAAYRGAKLVKQMLAFARQEILSPHPVDLARLTQELEPLIRQAIPGTIVTFDLESDLCPIMVDPVLLETALLNLAVNARDAMEGGGEVHFEARICPGDSPGHPEELAGHDAVAIAVRDNGAGIPPDVLRRVTEPFFTTKAPGKGTGLGLAMVHGFVSQSGGAMRLESTVGVGTTVTLYLPCPEDGTEANCPVLAEDVPIRGQARLLLVDDDEPVRSITAAQLRELGYSVEEAAGMEPALAMLEADSQFDCVITDVVMPGGNGIELARVVRSRVSGLPFLFMTGHTDLDRLAGERLIVKPFSATTLTHAIAALIDGDKPEPVDQPQGEPD